MDWDVAIKTSAKMLAWSFGAAIIGIIFVAIGFLMIRAGTADSVFENDSTAQIMFGFLVIVLGYIWIYVAAIAVLLKYFTEAITDPIMTSLSAIERRVMFIQQTQEANTRSTPRTPSPDSTPLPDPWSN